MTEPGQDPRDRTEELLVGLAIDALDSEDDRREAEQLVRDDPEAAAALDHYRTVAVELAGLQETEPPPHLKLEVMSRIGERGSSGSPPVRPPRSLHRYRRWTLVMTAVAAVSLAVAVPSLTIAVSQHNRMVEAAETSREIARIVTEPGAEVITTTTTTGSGRLAVVTAGSERSVVARDLPDLPDGRAYQLWAIDADGEPASAGLFDGDGGLIALTSPPPGKETAAVAVTDEPSEGSSRPTTDPVVVLAVEEP